MVRPAAARLHRLALLALVPLLAGSADARPSGLGPGHPIWPRPGLKDFRLYDRMVEVQAGMWRHISPEGLLVYRHRVGADGPRLSHDALALSDAAIWTGCYAGAQACRWKVTGDPDALEQCRRLARGLALLSDATGVPGRITRSVGRALEGESPCPGTVESPLGGGLRLHGDASRDQLSGIVFGWALLGPFVEDSEVRELARRHAGAIARRLLADGMWVRNWKGDKTKYGELRADVEHLPLLRKWIRVKNGMLASIGFAAILVGASLDPSDDLRSAVDRMRRDGWSRAMREQHTWSAGLVNASNVNMVNLALVSCVLHGDEETKADARHGMQDLRDATVGWWNAGFTGCQLLAGYLRHREEILGETRAVLHEMPLEEVFPGREWHMELDRIATISERGIQGWAWSDSVRRLRSWEPLPAGAPRETSTRADWLFGYWLARAAGELRPLVGPGADPRASRVVPDPPAPPAAAGPAGPPAR